MLNLNFKILHMGDKNLMIDANRRTDIEEKNIQGFFFFFGGFGGGGLLCTLQQSAGQHFYQLNTLHLFPTQCTLLKSFENIRSLHEQQFNSLDCIELHCIANC